MSISYILLTVLQSKILKLSGHPKKQWCVHICFWISRTNQNQKLREELTAQIQQQFNQVRSVFQSNEQGANLRSYSCKLTSYSGRFLNSVFFKEMFSWANSNDKFNPKFHKLMQTNLEILKSFFETGQVQSEDQQTAFLFLFNITNLKTINSSNLNNQRIWRF